MRNVKQPFNLMDVGTNIRVINGEWAGVLTSPASGTIISYEVPKARQALFVSHGHLASDYNGNKGSCGISCHFTSASSGQKDEYILRYSYSPAAASQEYNVERLCLLPLHAGDLIEYTYSVASIGAQWYLSIMPIIIEFDSIPG